MIKDLQAQANYIKENFTNISLVEPIEYEINPVDKFLSFIPNTNQFEPALSAGCA